MFCLQCLVHMQTRKRMRQKYGLEEEPCNDFHVTAWFVPFAASLPVHFATVRCRCIAYARSTCLGMSVPLNRCLPHGT